MMKGRDFVVFGLQPWDFEMGSNCKNVAMELAKNNRVLYINRPIERSSLLKFRHDPKIKARLNSVKNNEGVISKVQDNIWVFNPRVILESINWLPKGKLYDFFSQRNARKFGKEINWAMDSIGFKNVIFFNDNDMLKGLHLLKYVLFDRSIYYIRDFLLSQKYFVRHGTNYERMIMERSDIVVANSAYLANYARQFNKLSYDIGQGCDLEYYLRDNLSIPEDLQPIKTPIVGYVGALLTTRLNLHLLEEIASRRNDWSFVFVGPLDEGFKNSKLHQFQNVHFLGSKPVDSLANYVHYFDVCINPQALNQMTIGNYPRKIDEYLAAGKPVVATKTEAMEMFKEYCFLAEDADTYIFGIESMLSTTGDLSLRQERRQFALTHSWEASVNKIYEALLELEK